MRKNRKKYGFIEWNVYFTFETLAYSTSLYLLIFTIGTLNTLKAHLPEIHATYLWSGLVMLTMNNIFNFTFLQYIPHIDKKGTYWKEED